AGGRRYRSAARATTVNGAGPHALAARSVAPRVPRSGRPRREAAVLRLTFLRTICPDRPPRLHRGFGIHWPAGGEGPEPDAGVAGNAASPTLAALLDLSVSPRRKNSWTCWNGS